MHALNILFTEKVSVTIVSSIKPLQSSKSFDVWIFLVKFKLSRSSAKLQDMPNTRLSLHTLSPHTHTYIHTHTHPITTPRNLGKQLVSKERGKKNQKERKKTEKKHGHEEKHSCEESSASAPKKHIML